MLLLEHNSVFYRQTLDSASISFGYSFDEIITSARSGRLFCKKKYISNEYNISFKIIFTSRDDEQMKPNRVSLGRIQTLSRKYSTAPAQLLSLFVRVFLFSFVVISIFFFFNNNTVR